MDMFQLLSEVKVLRVIIYEGSARRIELARPSIIILSVFSYHLKEKKYRFTMNLYHCFPPAFHARLH